LAWLRSPCGVIGLNIIASEANDVEIARTRDGRGKGAVDPGSSLPSRLRLPQFAWVMVAVGNQSCEGLSQHVIHPYRRAGAGRM
jgi:hypothetical protein